MKKNLSILALCISTVVFAQSSPKTVKKEPPNKSVKETQANNSDDPSKNAEGGWMFVSAKTADGDMSSKYPLGFLDGKPRKMVLQPDGKVQYESEVVNKCGIKEAFWRIEKNEENGNYYLKFNTVYLDGMKTTESEKIIVADGVKLIFGKRLIVEYVRFKE